MKTELVEKKKKRWSKVAVGTVCESPCVFNYKNSIELWVMETENSQKLFSVSITQTQKSENWVMETKLWK